MPVRKVQGGYQWGKSGKVYPTKAQAEKQGRAIYASGYKEKPKKKWFIKPSLIGGFLFIFVIWKRQ